MTAKQNLLVSLLIILFFFTVIIFNQYFITKKVIVAPDISIVDKKVDTPSWRNKKIVIVTHNVIIEVPKYVTRIVTVNNAIVKEILITSENAQELANNFQSDILNLETSSLNVTMQPWVITNGIPQKEVTMDVSLAYLSWKLNVKNNYKIEQGSDIGIGLDYVLNDSVFFLNVEKKIGNIPFTDIPINIGLAYSLK